MVVTFILGGANANELNGGSFTTGGAADWANSQGTDGAAVDAITGATYTLQGGAGTDDLLTKTGEFVNAKVNQWVFISSAAEGAELRVLIKVVNSTNSIEFATVAWTNGRTDVIANVAGAVKQGVGAVSDTTIAFVDGGGGADTITDTNGGFTVKKGFQDGGSVVITGSASNNATFVVVTRTNDNTLTLNTGVLTAEGAGASVTVTILDGTTHLQALIDAAVAGDSLKAQAGLLVALKLDIDQNSGTGADRITLEGVSAATGERLALGAIRPIIKATAAIAEILDGSTDFWDIAALDFDGDSTATDCVDWNVAGTDCRFINIACHGAITRGLGLNSASGLASGCQFYDNSIGMQTSGNNIRVINCSIYDNAAQGALAYGQNVLFWGCLITGNAEEGIKKGQDSENDLMVINCTIADNDDGIFVQNGCKSWVIVNNIISGHNGAGKYGIVWETAGDEVKQTMIAYNDWYDNGPGGSDHTSEGTLADLGLGNITKNPDFADVAGSNYSIGNMEVLAAGVPDGRGIATLIGAHAIELTGPINRLRTRFSDAVHGYKIQ